MSFALSPSNKGTITSADSSSRRRESSRPRTFYVTPQRSWDNVIASISDNSVFFLCSSLATIAGLFLDDLRLMFSNGTGLDSAFDACIIISCCILMFDLIFKSISRPEYLIGFYFWTDFLSTISLIFDLSYLADLRSESPTWSVVSIGLKELRLIRFVRMTQNSRPYQVLLHVLLGLDRLYKQFPTSDEIFLGDTKRATDHEDQEVEKQIALEKSMPSLQRLMRPKLNPTRNTESDNVESQQESRLRLKLTDVNTIRIPVIVIICSTVTPLLSSRDDSVSSESFWLSDQHSLTLNASNTQELASYLDQLLSSLSTDLEHVGWIVSDTPRAPITINDLSEVSIPTFHPVDDLGVISSEWTNSCSAAYWLMFNPFCPDPLHRRPSEIRILSEGVRGFTIIMDTREHVKWEAILRVCRTLFIASVLLVTSFIFDFDCARRILIPLCRVISILRQIRHNPLRAKTLMDEAQERASQLKNAQTGPWWKKLWSTKPELQRFGTELGKLEATVLKLGSLLSVGFGEAGTKAMSSSINGTDLSDILRRKGTQLEAVFAYVEIKKFSEITHVLQDKIVLLVNRIAEIVHGIVDEYNGFICKNNTGPSGGFLIMWRLDELGGNPVMKTRIAELAVVALSQIKAAVEKCPMLNVYRTHPHLKQVIRDFSVTVTAALHAGSAIEGTTRTEFKLDATYLGKDIDITESLSVLASSTYTADLVLSGSVHDLLSKPFRSNLCREIDRASINDVETSVFVVDLDARGLSTQYQHDYAKQALKVRRQTTSRLVEEYEMSQARKDRKAKKLDVALYDPLKQFSLQELAIMRSFHNTKRGIIVQHLFRKGFLNFLACEWQVAWQAFEKMTRLKNEGNVIGSLVEIVNRLDSKNPSVNAYDLDGPTVAIMRSMKKNGDLSL